MQSAGFSHSDNDHDLYLKNRTHESTAHLILYVDNMMLAGQNVDELATNRSQQLLNYEGLRWTYITYSRDEYHTT